jgi:Large polyvalent protein associated domain 38
MGGGLVDLLSPAPQQTGPGQPDDSTGFGDLLSPMPAEQQGPLERAAATQANIQDQIDKLTQLRQTAAPEHQATLDALIQSMKDQLARGGEQQQGMASNLARGVAAGVAKGPVDVAELAASIPAALGSSAADNIRKSLAERSQAISETLHPEGVAGSVGEFAGSLPSQMLAFGPVGEAAGSVAGKVAPGLMDMLTEKAATGIAGRVAAGAARGAIEVAPITAIASAASLHDARKAALQSYQAGNLTQDQYQQLSKMNDLNAIKSFVMSTAGAAAFSAADAGVLGKGRAEAVLAEKNKVPTGPEAPPVAPVPATGTPDREAELTAINAKAAATAAAKSAAAKTRRLARAEWELANPNGSWDDDLSKVDKKKLVDDFAKRHPPTPTAQAGNTAPVSSAPPGEAPPATTAPSGPNLDQLAPPAVADEAAKQAATKAAAVAGVPVDTRQGGAAAQAHVQSAIDQQGQSATQDLVTKAQQLLKSDAPKSADAYRTLQDQWVKATGGDHTAFDAQVTGVDAGSPDEIAKNAVASLIHQTDSDGADLRADAVQNGNVPWQDALSELSKAADTGIKEAHVLRLVHLSPPELVEEGRVLETGNQDSLGIQHMEALIDSIAAQRGIDLSPGEHPYEGVQPGTPEAAAAVESEKAASAQAAQNFRDRQTVKDALAAQGAAAPPAPAAVAASGGGGEVAPPATTAPSGGGEPQAPIPAPEAPAVHLKTMVPDKPLSSLTVNQLESLRELGADHLVEAKGDAQLSSEIKADLNSLQTEILRRRASEAAEPRPYQHLDPGDLLNNKEALTAKAKDLNAQLKKLSTDDPTYEQVKYDYTDAKARLADIQTEINARKLASRQPGAPVVTAKAASDETAGVKPIPASEFRKAPSKLGDKDLARQIEDINRRLASLDPRESDQWQARLAKLLEEQAKRSTQTTGPDGMTPPKGGLNLNAHPAVTAFAGGTIYGLVGQPLGLPGAPNPNDPDYLSRAFMFGLGAAGLVMGAKYLAARRGAMDSSDYKTSLFPDMQTKIISADMKKGEKIPTTTALRNFYRGTVRGTEALDYLLSATGGRQLPTQRNPAKLAAFIGRYAAQAESWLGYRPSLVNDAGNVQWLTGHSLDEILQMAKGNKADLDALATAYSSAELAGTLGENKVPMKAAEREKIIRSAPQYLVDAVKALREYHANLLRTQLDAGLITQDGFNKMVSEQFYTPLQRAIERVETLEAGKKNFKAQPTAVEARAGGSNLTVVSPYDTSVSMTARMLRAAEYGKFMTSMFDYLDSLPKVIKDAIVQPVNIAANPKGDKFEEAAADLQKVLHISAADAKGMLSYAGTSDIQGNPGVIRVFRNGVARNYRVRQDIFNAIKSLDPWEADGFWRVIGAPTRLATKGVVINPAFTVRRGIIETFLGFMGSEYGFRPVLDQIPAWWDAFTRSDRYREMQAAGGVGSVQSIQYRKLVGIRGENAAQQAWKLVGQGHYVDAWRTLMEPTIEAARVAEYLAAKRHGASTLEAAYAANNLLGNVRMQGNFQGMRVFNYLSMFARPTISHVDRLLEKSGLHPFRVPEYNKTSMGEFFQQANINPRVAGALTFATKGFIGVALPTMALWYMNKGDDEIDQLRRTEVGTHYWFMRNPAVPKGQDGSIIRIPKPQVIGPLFGGAMEAALDKHYHDDPDGTMRALSGIWDEAALNVVPQIGVIPLSLWANKDLRYGTPIVPESSAGADPAMQGYDNASLPSRFIANAISPYSQDLSSDGLRRLASPAGMDYVMNTFAGMFGQDALRAVNDALIYKQQGYLPAKEEWPLVSRFMGRYPSMNTYDAQKFYDNSAKIQAASTTVNKLLAEDPSKLADYYAQNGPRIALAKVYGEVRQQVANYRRALEDLKDAPPGTISKDQMEQIQKTIMQAMLSQMATANQAAEQMGMK